ncbi:FxSxx-COOH system tetratricopeptide repeat protein [Kitasatospora sp. NPDC054939]
MNPFPGRKPRPEPTSDGPEPTPDGPGTAAAHLDVRASGHSIAAGGDITITQHVHSPAPPAPPAPSVHPVPPEPEPAVLVVDAIPATASGFQPRTELRARIDAARAAGGPVVLTQLFSGAGGVGKTQLAAAYAAEAVHRREVDLVVWVPAGEEQRIVGTYARAALRARVPDAAGLDAEQDARAFLRWLATTGRRWLVVLDDIADPADVDAWWPACHTGAGWVLATTRRQDARLTGSGRRRVVVDVFSPAESRAYLAERLGRDDCAHLLDDRAADLAEALGHLPLALAHAAAYMINEDRSCAVYLERFQDRATTLDRLLPPEADTEGYGRAITATLLLSLDAAQATDPAGLAAPLLGLTALLDPVGHPDSLWTTESALAHLTAVRAGAADPPGAPVTEDEARAALRVLHRYALLTVEPSAVEPSVAGTAPTGGRTVRVHALTARAARETAPAEGAAVRAVAVADALLDVWPDPDETRPALAAVLRANTDALARHTDEQLWSDEGHPVLVRAGLSFLDAHKGEAATAYWQRMADRTEQRLGPEHPDTLVARANLASAHWLAGRADEAIAIEEQLVADQLRLHGEGPQVVVARGNLAASYRDAGRYDEAVALDEQGLREAGDRLGPLHPYVLTARRNLASSYARVGRLAEAVLLLEALHTDCRRVLGATDPVTLGVGNNLAVYYRLAGSTDRAVQLGAWVLQEQARLFGPTDPRTLAARTNLATALGHAGQVEAAAAMEEENLAVSEAERGHDHPDTLTVRANLAMSYSHLDRLPEAIDLLGTVLAARERVLGPGHPDTVITRSNLASLHRQSGRPAAAIDLGRRVVEDLTRLLGEGHPDTLVARANLAAAHHDAEYHLTAAVLGESVTVALARRYGDDHPNTRAARANLAAAYWKLGRTADAVALHRRYRL